MKKKTIIILGGGVGGIVTANNLRRLLPPEHKIILVEKNKQHAFAPSFLWVMTGDRKPESITNNLSNLVLEGIEIINSEVTNIQPNVRSVETGNGKLTFDYLVVALGAEYSPETIPGLADESHTYYTFDGSLSLYNRLRSFEGGKIAVVISSLPYKCPAAPHEGAMLIADFFRRKGIRKQVEVNIYTPEAQPMPVGDPELGKEVRKIIESKGIGFYPLHKLRSVEPAKHELHFEDNETVHYDVLVAIPPHRSPAVIRNSALAGETGWIPVNGSTLQTKFESVYAIGDVTAIQIPGRWKPDVPMMLPKAGVFAHLQAEAVAKRIADEINGKEPKDEFSGEGFCMLETGESTAGFAYGKFYAEPAPDLKFRETGKIWHWGKVLFEKWWLSPFGFKKAMLHQMMNIGGKLKGIPIKM